MLGNWLLTWYLFLGGAGGGLFLTSYCALLANCFRPNALSPVYMIKAWPRILITAAFALACGSICLLKDLSRSGQAFYLLVKPTLSAISIGAYSLVALVILLVALLAITYRRHDSYHLKLTLFAGGAAAILSVVVILYTGVLLQSIAAVPSWRSPLVILIFAASSLSSGIGLFALVLAPVFRERTVLTRDYAATINADTVILILEAVLIVVFAYVLLDAYGQGVFANFLPNGSCARAFWLGVVGVGIVTSLVLHHIPFSRIKTGFWLFLAANCTALIGAFFLRYCFIFGGVHISSIILLGV